MVTEEAREQWPVRAWRAFEAEPWGMAITALCIAASVGVGTFFAITFGRDMTRPVLALLIVVAVMAELCKCCYIPLTWKRGRWQAALVALPFFAASVAYSANASYKFAEENLIKRSWAADEGSSRFFQLRDDIKALSKRIEPLSSVRSASIIQSEITNTMTNHGITSCEVRDTRAQTIYCPGLDERGAELVKAKERDQLMAERTQKQAILDGLPKPTRASADMAGGGPIAALIGWIGYDVTWNELVAGLIMALVELGAFTSSSAFIGGGVPTPGRKIDLSMGLQPDAQASSLDHGDDRVNQVRAFFETRCERRHGAVLKVTSAWDAFAEWCRDTKQAPRMNEQHFKMIASTQLRIPKKVMTTNGARGMHYLNMALKTTRAGMVGNVIQLTRVAAAGRA